jgi:uncharacterized protein
MSASASATRSSSIGIVIEQTDIPLGPAPIPHDWILSGDPVATNHLNSRSADGTAAGYIWQCTPGRFTWHYGVDEWLYILEGDVTLTEPDGLVRRMGAGDFVFFPGGTWATWEIHSTVRKVAIMRERLSRPMMATKSLVLTLRRMMGKKPPVTGM